MPKEKFICTECGARVSEKRHETLEVRRALRTNAHKQLSALDKLLMCRAGRLLRKGKPFVVVACDEPYYLDVYRLIRQHEKAKDDWTGYDEKKFMEAVDRPVDTSIRWRK